MILSDLKHNYFTYYIYFYNYSQFDKQRHKFSINLQLTLQTNNENVHSPCSKAIPSVNPSHVWWGMYLDNSLFILFGLGLL